jgi:hypothetical protein
MIITMRDVRAAKMCSEGARYFFRKNNLNWSMFLKEGIPSDELELINDAMSARVIEVARVRR